MTISMTDHPLYDRQIALEAEMFDAGARAYQRQVKKDHDRGQAGASGGGKELVKNVLPPFTEAIKGWIAHMDTHHSGKFPDAYDYVIQIEPEVLAFITARIVLDRVLSRGGATLTRSAIEVGKWVETEIRVRNFEKKNKKLVDQTLHNLDKRSANRDFRRHVVLHLLNTKGDKSKPWGAHVQMRLGLLLIEKLIEGTNIVAIVEAPGHGKIKGEHRVVAIPQLLTWLGQTNDALEMMSPMSMPCIIPPKPWSTPRDGGYWSDELRQLNPIMRGFDTHRKERMRLLDVADLSAVYRTINTLQSTAWEINRPVLAVMQKVWDGGLDIGVLPNREPLPLPAKPADIDTNEAARLAWKRATALTHADNAKSISRKLNVVRAIDMAKRYTEFPSMYFVYQADFRGRLYAAGSGPNPQGADYQKGLIRFAEGKAIGDNGGPGWLAIHGANTYGVDKVSLEDRIDWVEENQANILACADDPLGDLWWTEADAPWCFLAFCFEWAGYCRDGAAFVTRLPVMVDGTCNGLQHYSAMLRDPVGGEATNLIPSELPQDIYGRVAVRVIERLRVDCENPEKEKMAWAWRAFGIDRKTTKRPVMVLPYGGTFNSCKDYVREAVMERKPLPFTEDQQNDALNYLTQHVWDSIGDVVVAARDGMAFIRKLSSAASAAKKHVTWTTPSGWPCLQQYFPMNLIRYNCIVMGERVQIGLSEPDTNGLDARRSGQGLAPNFVHSMDAAALIGMVNLCLDQPAPVTQFAVVHDSFGTLAPDMDTLSDGIRHAFVRMYDEHDVLSELRSSVAEAVGDKAASKLPDRPTYGSLDLTKVLDSQFFFA